MATTEATDIRAKQLEFKRDMEALGRIVAYPQIGKLMSSTDAPTVAYVETHLKSTALHLTHDDALQLLEIIKNNGAYDQVPQDIQDRIRVLDEAKRLLVVFADLMDARRVPGSNQPYWFAKESYHRPVPWW